MSEEINFQWQNEFLLRTIYPMRATKLRDFLVYFQEVDLWAAYQLKTDQDLEPEAQAFQTSRQRAWDEAFTQYETLKNYFLTQDPSNEIKSLFPIPEQTENQKILATHNDFAHYFPKLKSFNSQGYFISQYITRWENNRKEVLTTIAQKQRAIDVRRPDWSQRATYEKQIQDLKEVGMPMADRELDQLYDFLAAFTKVKARQANLDQLRGALLRQRQEAAPRYDRALSNLRLLEQQLVKAADALRPLQFPPDVPALEAYFVQPDVKADYAGQFDQPNDEAIARFNLVHKDLAFTLNGQRSLAVRTNQVRIQVAALETFLRKVNFEITAIERRLAIGGPGWPLKGLKEQELQNLRQVKLAMGVHEMGLLTDLLNGYANTNLAPPALAAQLAQKEKTLADLQTKVDLARQETGGYKNTLDGFDALLSLPDKEQLEHLGKTQKATRVDIVRGKVEEYYKACLEKDESALLEEAVARFLADPGRYPVWLQYMVVHFSGMRYQSAHGSWANPKDLLISLGLKDISKEINRLDDETIGTMCQEKLSLYTTPAAAPQADGPASIPRPQLAQANALAWQTRVTQHLKGLRSTSPYQQRKALLELIIDEKNYEIESLSDEQVDERLRALKDDLPAWMWNEIVRLTDLRLTEVNQADWENPTALELAERNAYQAGSFRQLLNDWKQEYLTGWRKEHGRSLRLIVTRAVCNEVAEHIQHLRGQSPGGGLTNKPLFYQRMERDPKWSTGPDKAYFVRALTQGDFKVGASILFLSFTNNTPSPWQIANPIQLKTGEGLVPEKLFNEGSERWSYRRDDAGHVIRSGDVFDSKGQKFHQEHTMRWLHEATVALVAETADGTTVLTFETALPTEPRSRSTIGVFKHTLNGLIYRVDKSVFSGTFIGYVPQAELPLDNLKEMLDWNKILRRPALTPAEQDAYWQKALHH